jgi:hypothetical protein
VNKTKQRRNKVNVTTTLLSILGFFLFIAGSILVLAGLGIITIKQYVEITRGFRALLAGLGIVILGTLLLLPEARTSLLSSPTATPVTILPTDAIIEQNDASSSIASTENSLLPEVTVSPAALPSVSSVPGETPLYTPTSPPTSSPTTQSPVATEHPPTTSPECTPPAGLIPLWINIEPPWSRGLWGSPNMPAFMVALGEIDTNDPEFSEFQMWIDPCYVSWHDYTDGGRFWPQQEGVPTTAPPIPLGGETATTVNLTSNTGRWSLGPRY